MSAPSVASLARIFRDAGVAKLEPRKKPRAAFRRFVYAHGAGPAGPHAVTSATTASATTTYGYDAAGNRTSVQVGTMTTGYQWDAEGELTATGDTSNVYDADGNRIIRADANGTTIYAGGQEIQIPTTGAVKATRYYSFAEQTVAVRTDRGLGSGVTSLIADHHGTPIAAIPNGGHPANTTINRLYTNPYGATRGASNAATIPGDTQFLGKTRDNTTGLTLIGARYYDEAVGTFISVDPVMDPHWLNFEVNNADAIPTLGRSGMGDDLQQQRHRHPRCLEGSDARDEAPREPTRSRHPRHPTPARALRHPHARGRGGA